MARTSVLLSIRDKRGDDGIRAGSTPLFCVKMLRLTVAVACKELQYRL